LNRFLSNGEWSAVGGALIVSVVGWVLSGLVREDRRDRAR
jgi:uncharacterized membrane protein YvlD (DUF360 family)